MFRERIKTHHSAMGEGQKYVAGVSCLSDVLGVENTKNQKNATIYIHVPFCNKICSFCNMRRSLQSPTEDYAKRIVQEIEKYATFPYIRSTTFDAVYFGGGTPTTLSSEDLCLIVSALKANLSFTEDAEFTIETTVTELTEEKMKAVIDAGVNRFSVGVQTFADEGRQQMGRIGNGTYAYERLHQLKQFSGVTVSMDLIYNYPNQTMESLNEDLDRIIDLDLDGFSMYSLINMRGASIAKAQDEENDARMFYTIAEKMKEKGYYFLELTKMVKRDRYRYIMNRHMGADTLPLGAGGGGSINHLAVMNPINLEEYAQSVSEFEKRKGMLFIPEYQKIVRFKGAIQTTYLPKEEDLYLDKSVYQRFRTNLMEQGMVVYDSGRYRLTEKGIFWGNTISRALSQMIAQ